jgi:FkbM family methyltransferase
MTTLHHRAMAHGRYLLAVLARLTLARRALRPRLPRRSDRVRAGVVVAALWTRAAMGRDVPVPALRMLVGGRSTRVRVRDDSEFFGSYEVLSTDAYSIDCGKPVERVLDLGANVGFASILLSERYPAAQIVAVEAAPDTFAALSANVAGLPRVRPLHLAVGSDGDALVDMALPSAERRVCDAGRMAVPGASLTRLLGDLGWETVDLMKIDVEGAEREVFGDPAMGGVRAIVGEIHGPASRNGVSALSATHRVECTPVAGDPPTQLIRAWRRDGTGGA